MVERKQLPKESFADYYTEMIEMNFRLAQPMSDAKMIDLIKNNVKESFGSIILTTELFNLEHLRDVARKAEMYTIRQQRLRMQKRVVSEVDMSENIDEETSIDTEIAAIKFQGYHNRERKEIDTKNFKCWNCGEIGHSFHDCQSEKRSLFCFRCGEKNVTSPQCKKHSKINKANE